MNSAKNDEERRLFEMILDINATPDDVWRALTEAEELVRWFPWMPVSRQERAERCSGRGKGAGAARPASRSGRRENGCGSSTKRRERMTPVVNRYPPIARNRRTS